LLYFVRLEGGCLWVAYRDSIPFVVVICRFRAPLHFINKGISSIGGLVGLFYP
jgi:hypothetical protein